MTNTKQLLRGSAWILLALAASACGADGTASNETYSASTQAVVGQHTFLYFHCNATGWIPSPSTRLVASSTPGTWTITYDVAQPWMITGWDTCTLVETNQRDGWGTRQKYYDKTGMQQLTVPATGGGTGQYALARPGQDYHFGVQYPALGKYRMSVNWQTKSFSIERADTPVPSAWLWPVTGQDGKDWVINNYVDLDPSPAILDYRGGTKSYDSHAGTDIDIPSFREMDLGQPVLAVTAGQVTAVADHNYDRNTSCQGDWNYVDVRTDDGYQISYGHLKQNSVAVSVGTRVEAGATLGMVGSSGCSTWPHLHLEARRSSDGAVVDPFLDGLWASPPVYDPPLTVMDSFVTDAEIVSSDTIANPPPNAAILTRGGWLGVGINAAGGDVGDYLSIAVTQSDGTLFQWADIPMTEPVRHTIWYFNWIIGTEAPTGPWLVEILVNGTVSESHTVQVN